jgi:hypothetical protein
MQMAEIDLSKVVPVADLRGEDADDTNELLDLHRKATDYILSFKWCRNVREDYHGLGIGGVFAVCLLRIEATSAGVPEWLWVVIGDLPPAYLCTDDAPNPASALDSYIGEMQRWIRAVKNKAPLDEVIPVNAPATLEYAKMLESRLEFLDREVLSHHKKDLSTNASTAGA